MLTIAELCMGYGGLGMGLELAGIETELAWCAEIDPHASKVIAHHWPDVANLGDLTELTDPPAVDIIAAGFPCQDISDAGKGAGINGSRSGLWWTIADIVGDLRPRWVLLENVAAIARLGGVEVVGALAAMGYGVRWVTLRASDVGAPHQRARWFCLATAPDAGSVGRVERAGPSASESAELRRDGPNDGRRAATTWGPYANAIERWAHVTGRPCPDPRTDSGLLDPLFVEWMMGLPAGHVTGIPSGVMDLFGGSTPTLSRKHQLRILGNGVVPQQAAKAVMGLDRHV